MAGQFRGNSSDNPDPAGPSRFAEDLQPLFGDDPDPLFLEESWTLGVPAAVERLHQRRQDRAERERQSRAFRELDHIAVLSLSQANSADVHSYFADRAAGIASHYAACSSHRAPATHSEAHREAWSPEDWTPEDRDRQRWIPPGWIPKEVASHLDVTSQADPAAADIRKACELLGVTIQSTPAEIRSAYRRRVVQCHPDRQQHAPEAVRRQATRCLAELNDAYRLLRTNLLRRAA